MPQHIILLFQYFFFCISIPTDAIATRCFRGTLKWAHMMVIIYSFVMITIIVSYMYLYLIKFNSAMTNFNIATTPCGPQEADYPLWAGGNRPFFLPLNSSTLALHLPPLLSSLACTRVRPGNHHHYKIQFDMYSNQIMFACAKFGNSSTQFGVCKL